MWLVFFASVTFYLGLIYVVFSNFRFHAPDVFIQCLLNEVGRFWFVHAIYDFLYCSTWAPSMMLMVKAWVQSFSKADSQNESKYDLWKMILTFLTTGSWTSCPQRSTAIVLVPHNLGTLDYSSHVWLVGGWKSNGKFPVKPGLKIHFLLAFRGGSQLLPVAGSKTYKSRFRMSYGDPSNQWGSLHALLRFYHIHRMEHLPVVYEQLACILCLVCARLEHAIACNCLLKMTWLMMFQGDD